MTRMSNIVAACCSTACQEFWKRAGHTLASGFPLLRQIHANKPKKILSSSLLIKKKCVVSKENSNNDTENTYYVIYKASIHLK